MSGLVLVAFLALLAVFTRVAARQAGNALPTRPGRPNPTLLRRVSIALSLGVLAVSSLGALEASAWYDRSSQPFLRDRDSLRTAGNYALVEGVIAETTHACPDRAFAVCADGSLGLQGLELVVGDARILVSHELYRPVGWPMEGVGGEQMPALRHGQRLVLLGDVRQDRGGAHDFGIAATLAMHGEEKDMRRALLWRAGPGVAAVVLGLLFGILGLVKGLRLKAGATCRPTPERRR
jgi:hypothetical protein